MLYVTDYFPPEKTLCNLMLQFLYMENYEIIQCKKKGHYMFLDGINNVKSLSILGSERMTEQ